MKKTLFLLLAILLFRQIAISQSTFGLQAGGNLAYQKISFISLSMTKEHNYTHSLTGGQFGVFYKTKMSKRWTLASELNFSLISARQIFLTLNHSDSALTAQDYNQRMGYVELPLTVQYNIHSFYIGAGPSVSFRAFIKGRDAAYNSIFQTTDMAANLLLGYKFIKRWDINVRYNYGLLDITKANYEYSYGNSNKQIINNRFVSLSLLYSLR